MEISIKMQAMALVLSVAVGIIFGVLYDAVRLIRVIFGISVRPPKRKRDIPMCIAAAVGDLAFFLMITPIMCVFFFVMNNGIVRGYVLFGALLGFVLYYNTVGRLFIGICQWLADLIKDAARAVIRLLLALIRLVLRPLTLLASLLCKYLQNLLSPIATRLNNWYNQRKKLTEEKRRIANMRKRRKNCGVSVKYGTGGDEFYESAEYISHGGTRGSGGGNTSRTCRSGHGVDADKRIKTQKRRAFGKN